MDLMLLVVSGGRSRIRFLSLALSLRSKEQDECMVRPKHLPEPSLIDSPDE